MTFQIFNLPPQQPLSAAGRILPGAKATFYLTGTSTLTDTYTTSALSVAHANPVIADAGGRFAAIYLDPDITYKVTITDANDVLLYTIDPVNDQLLSQSVIGEYLFPRTAAEIAASLTPDDYAIPSHLAVPVVYLSRYLGWDPTGVASSHQAFANALELIYDQGANHTDASQIGGVIVVPDGLCLLSQAVTIGQDRIIVRGGHGATIRTNDDFFAFVVESADLQKTFGVEFRDLRFTSSVTDRGSGSGAIKFVASEKWAVRDCAFHLRTERGVHLVDTIIGRVTGCKFDSGSWQTEGLKYGISSEATNDVATSGGSNIVAIRDCSFSRTTEAAIALLGQPISNSPTLLRKESSGDSILQCHFEHNYGDGVQLTRNRAYAILGNWLENGGLDAASGRGHIMDKATDDDETSGGGANSGQNAALTIQGNTFGGHDSAHADFQHIGLKFAINAGIIRNYFTDGIIGLTADCHGLRMEDNWASGAAPTLAGALPTICYLRNNRRGPNSSISTQRAWGGSFADRNPDNIAYTATDADTTPSLITSNGERIHTLFLTNTGATSVTYFDDGYDGQILRVIATNGNTTLVNGTDNALNLNANSNVTLGASDCVEFYFVASSGGFTNRWIEKGRADS